MLTINNSNTKKSLKSVKSVFNTWSAFFIISQCFFHTWSIIMASTTSDKPTVVGHFTCQLDSLFLFGSCPK